MSYVRMSLGHRLPQTCERDPGPSKCCLGSKVPRSHADKVRYPMSRVHPGYLSKPCLLRAHKVHGRGETLLTCLRCGATFPCTMETKRCMLAYCCSNIFTVAAYAAANFTSPEAIQAYVSRATANVLKAIPKRQVGMQPLEIAESS